MAERSSHEFLDWLDDWTAALAEQPLADVIAASGGPEAVGILSVDLICGFCHEGPLSSPRVAGILPAVTDLMRRAHTAGVRDFALAQDAHPLDAPEFAQFGPHCVAGTREAETAPELLALPFSDQFTVLPKGSLSATIRTDLPAWLAARPELKTLIFVGDCTDLCIYNAAMPLRLEMNAGGRAFRLVVPEECVQTYHVSVADATRVGILPHDGDLLHRVFLYHMALNGIEVVKRLI